LKNASSFRGSDRYLIKKHDQSIMNSRERVIRACNLEEPDTVPIYATFTSQVESALRSHLGVDEGEDVGLALGNDVVSIENPFGIEEGIFHNLLEMKEGDTYTNKWGIVWQHIGYYNEMVKHPLADISSISELDDLDFDSYFDEGLFKGIEEQMKRHSGDFATIFGELSLFEASWFLRGFERFMKDLLSNERFALRLIDKVQDFFLKLAKRLLEYDIDMILASDDVGMEKNMLISPAVWRKVLKPRWEEMFRELRKKKRDLIICYHTCGHVTPIIPDLIDVGIDVLNPVQPRAMDPSELKEEFGDRLAFWGTVDEQRTLPYGSVADVESEVKLRIETVGSGGGLILAPSHNIQPDTSLENIMAFYRASKKYGNYGGD